MESKKEPYQFYAFIRHAERGDHEPDAANRLIDQEEVVEDDPPLTKKGLR